MHSFTDHASLLAVLGGGAEVASGINALPVTVRAWSARNRIPPEYWPDIIRLSETKGHPVTAEWLMHSTPARKREEQQAEAA